MPDLQPDTSIYRNVGQPTGIGALSLPQLLGLVQQSRALQTQQGMSDALKSSVDPSGLPNPSQGLSTYLHNPNVYATPDDVAHFTTAAQTQANYQQEQTSRAMEYVTNVIGLGPKATKQDALDAVMMGIRSKAIDPMVGFGVVQSLPDDIGPGKGSPKLLPALVQYKSLILGGNAIPTTGVPTGAGDTSQVPSVIQNQRAIAGGGPGGGGAPGGGPGYISALGPTKQQSIKDYTTDQQANTQFQTITQPLRDMIPKLAQNPNLGVGAEDLNSLKSLYSTVARQMGVPVDTSNIATIDMLKKDFARWSEQSAAGQAVAHLYNTIAGSPNASLQTATNYDISRLLLGLARMNYSKVGGFDEAVQNSGGALKQWDYNDWQNKHFNKEIGYQGFMADMMTKKERRDLLTSMSPAEQGKFKNTVGLARRLGMYDMPQPPEAPQ